MPYTKTHRCSVWIPIAAVGLLTLPPPTARAQLADLFSDGFCCGHLDDWRKWVDEDHTLLIFNKSGTLQWENSDEGESFGGIATGELPAGNYQFRMNLLKWPTQGVTSCVYVRAGTGEIAYSGYRLRLEGETAFLERHDGGPDWREAVQVQGPAAVAPDVFHTVLLMVTGVRSLRIEARIWKQTESMPTEPQLVIEDPDPLPVTHDLGGALWFRVEGRPGEPFVAGDAVSVLRAPR